jgi:hypothetical protein
MTDPTLTPAELGSLAHHEEVIAAGCLAFVDVGNALAAIRHGKLYRERFATFEAYCQERWEFSKRHCDRLIASAGVLEKLGPIGPILPASESQARPLTTIDLEQVGDVWQKVIGEAKQIDADGKPKITAKLVGEVVEKWKGGKSDDTPEPEAPSDTPAKTCPNCGHDEFDDEGDCTKCWDPPADADVDPEPDDESELPDAEADIADTCMSLHVDTDGGAVELILDTGIATYGEWIEGEGADICLHRCQDTHKIVGCRLPLKNARLAVFHAGELKINEGFGK